MYKCNTFYKKIEMNAVTVSQKVFAEAFKAFYLFLRDPPCMKKRQPAWRVNIQPIRQ